MTEWVKPPILHPALKGLRGYRGASQPYFNKAADDERFIREIKRAHRRKAAESEERLTSAERLHIDRVGFGVAALWRLKETVDIVTAKRKVADRRNPPVVHYTDGTTSLDRAKT